MSRTVSCGEHTQRAWRWTWRARIVPIDGWQGAIQEGVRFKKLLSPTMGESMEGP